MQEPTLAYEVLSQDQYDEVVAALEQAGVEWYFVKQDGVTTFGVIVIQTQDFEDACRRLYPKPSTR